MTAQEIVALGIKRFGGNVGLANQIRLREIRPADNLGQQVRRWGNGTHEPPGDVIVRVLHALKAIDWDALKDPPGSAEAAKPDIRDQTDEIRGRIERRPIDPPDQEEEESTP